MQKSRIVALIFKEILVILKDPKSRLAILLPPFLQLFLFAYAATLDVKDVPIGILNLDNGVRAFQLVQRFHGSPVFSKIKYLQKAEDIKPFIDNQKGIMVVFIKEDFSRNFDAHKTADIQLILDGRKSNTAQILAGYTNTILYDFSTQLEFLTEYNQQNTNLILRYWFNPNLLYYWYNIACLVATLSMITCLIVTSQSVARERELGTFSQLLVSPLAPFEVLIGKTLPGILIGFIEGSLMMLIGIFVLGVPFTGSPLVFFFSLFIFVTSVSGVGLFISALSMTQQQALLGTFVFLLPSILLSGFATPIENMPIWLQPVTYGIPLKYMLVISKGLFLKAMSVKTVLENLWPMVIIGFFNLIGASFCFRRRLE